jgi:hypothetical protein
MAIVPGFDYDLFVSYAHADDSVAEGQIGWVTQFVRQLEPALRQRLGGVEALKIFFDSRATGANSNLPELLDAVRRSALFLAVGSPSYSARDWPHQELATFVERMPDLSRLFMIECLPLSDSEQYPPPLDNHIRLEFWKASGRRQIPMTILPTSDAQEFSTLVHGLASDLRERLLSVRYSVVAQTQTGTPAHSEIPRVVTSVTQGADPPEKKKTILLAQTTDDVEDEADQLRRYLNQYGDEIAVLPKGGYSQGGEAFMSAFQQDLARADLFVQLLGHRAGRVPPDLPQGYTGFQLNAAKVAGVEIMQWRHPDLDTSGISDASYQNILTAETVVASGLEAFKSEVLVRARKRRREPRKNPSPTSSPTVFINADDKDMTIAREIERECLRQALTTFLPMSGPSSEANRKDLAENLTDCDVLLFIYGDSTQDWIRSQLRFFGKVKPKRDADPKLLAICSGPPAQKPDIGISIPNAHVINCTEGWDMPKIRALLAELAP